MPNRSRSKRPLQRLRSHNSDGLTETEHRRSSSAMDRHRPSSNSSGHGSSPSKSASRHSSSRSSRVSRSRSRSPKNSRTSVSSVVVQPNQGNGQRQAEEDLAPAWAKRMLEAHEKSQARLLRLEAELSKSDKRREMQDGTIKQKHKFNKAIYEEQYSLNFEKYKKLEEATVTEDFEERNSILKEGMNLLTQRNKVLILSDKYGWETAATYSTDPVASDSEDEKRIKRARKEAKATKDEKAKLKNLKQKPNFQSKEPFGSLQQGQPKQQSPSMHTNTYRRLFCWRCGKPGYFAKACKSPVPENFGPR